LIFWKSTRHPGTPKNITQRLWQLCDCNHESPAFAHELCLQCPREWKSDGFDPWQPSE
jgi:hypothetical protein